jgi:hypothetical protein
MPDRRDRVRLPDGGAAGTTMGGANTGPTMDVTAGVLVDCRSEVTEVMPMKSGLDTAGTPVGRLTMMVVVHAIRLVRIAG